MKCFSDAVNLSLNSVCATMTATDIKLPTGLTPLRVIADYLRFLKECALGKLWEQWGSDRVAASDVTWAVTVPAAWSELAKKTMRLAVVQAGIVSSPTSRWGASSIEQSKAYGTIQSLSVVLT